MGEGGREIGVPERGDSPFAVFLVSYKPSQQFFWVSRNVEASVGYLFTGSFHLSFPSFPKKRLILRLEAVNLISRITTEKHTKKNFRIFSKIIF